MTQLFLHHFKFGFPSRLYTALDRMVAIVEVKAREILGATAAAPCVCVCVCGSSIRSVPLCRCGVSLLVLRLEGSLLRRPLGGCCSGAPCCRCFFGLRLGSQLVHSTGSAIRCTCVAEVFPSFCILSLFFEVYVHLKAFDGLGAHRRLRPSPGVSSFLCSSLSPLLSLV